MPPRLLIGLLGLCLQASLGSSALAKSLDVEPVVMHREHALGDPYMGVRMLAALELPSAKVDGLPMVELSALAWDADAELLYVLSDNGYLFHLRLRQSGDHMSGVDAVAGFRLRDADGKPLRGKFADSEGLLLRGGDDGIAGNSELLVSYERRPRLLRMTPQGKTIAAVKLSSRLADKSSYTTENKALEGVAMHPQWGLLVAPEWPMKGEPTANYPIFALEQGEKSWQYPRFAAPKAGLVAMEALEDGSLLSLERAYVSMWQPMYVVLRRSQPLPAPGSEEPLTSTLVAEFGSHKGWLIDNFEGLTRQQGQRFLMISDDNRRSFQRTLLVWFELLDEGADSAQ